MDKNVIKAMDGFLNDPKYIGIVKGFQEAQQDLKTQRELGVPAELLRGKAAEYQARFSKEIQAYVQDRRAQLKGQMSQVRVQTPAGEPKDPQTSAVERQDYAAKVSLMNKDELMGLLYSTNSADDYELTVLRDASKAQGIEHHYRETVNRVKSAPKFSLDYQALEQAHEFLTLLDHPRTPLIYTPKRNAAGEPIDDYQITHISEITREA